MGLPVTHATPPPDTGREVPPEGPTPWAQPLDAHQRPRHSLPRMQRNARRWSLSVAKRLRTKRALRLRERFPVLDRASRRYLDRLDRACVTVCDAPFRLDVLRRSVSRSVYLGGRWHAGVVSMLRNHVRPGMTAVDVGANVGYMAVHMGDVAGPEGTVLAFEPEPRNFEILSWNARQARWRNLIPFQVAVGDHVGEARLWISPDDGGDHRMMESDPARACVTVPLTSLDALAEARHTHLDFVKMDIQGAEGQALRGMRETLRSPHLSGVVIEFWPDALHQAGEDPAAILAMLRDAGLRCASVPAVDLDPKGFLAGVGPTGWNDLLFLRG